MHSRFELLIQYSQDQLNEHREDQLNEHERKDIEKHLAKCAECRRELELLLQAANSDVNPLPPSSLETARETARSERSLNEILSGTRQWTANQRLGGNVESVKGRVAAAITPFLGPSATSTVLGTVSPDGGNLLQVIEPVLAVFLGRGAAASLVSHVVDTAIVRPIVRS
jgi:anti-sigma factor RsiW